MAIKEISLIFKLLFAIFVGAFLGTCLGTSPDWGPVKVVMSMVVSLRHILDQILFFLVPLVIVGFITPSIIRLEGNASHMLFTFIAFAFLSSLGAAIFTMLAGCMIIWDLPVPTLVEPLHPLPDIEFQLDFPPLFSLMTALVVALFFGVATAWTRSAFFSQFFAEFERIMLALINKVFIPLLPFFVGLCFLSLAYEGLLSHQLPGFLSVLLIVILGHIIWMAVLYGLAALVSGRNPFEVLRHYLPAYLSAVGTMSSAATLPVALRCARKSKVLSRTTTEFVIPLGAMLHMCGCVISLSFFSMTLHLMLYGSLPSMATMLVFCVLLAFFVLNAPGVPGGAAVASVGVVTGVLGFDANGVALLLALFALQDSFGTACNVTSDGALALMMEGIFNRHGELGPLQTGEEEDGRPETDADVHALLNAALAAPDSVRDDSHSEQA